MNFSDLELDPKVLQAVEEAGYAQPTPIQEQAIPHALMGKDVLGIAQTGTGKTASFTLPMITILAQGRAKARMPRSLILCPTRELAAQVAENFETYGKYHKLSMALLIGGVSFKDQDKLIDRGVDVLIATPGRLLDHFERGKLMLTGVQVMVVDEADRMLDMGFIPDLERIFGLLPFTRQTLFFSATMPPEITRLTETFLHAPVRIEVAKQATAAETIEQGVVRHKPSAREKAEREKRDLLRTLISAEGDSLTNAIVFCNRKRDVDVVFKSLKKHGFNAGALHGDLDQSIRTRTLDGFRSGEITVLVASDVAARGLDIPSVSHVFNFDVPIHSEDYVHRIGRTGRAGRKGKAVTLCFPHEEKHLVKIDEMLGKPVPRLDDPLSAQVEDAPAEAAATPEPQEEAPKPRRRARAPRARRKEVEDAPAQAEAHAPQPEPEAEPKPAPSRRRRTAAEERPEEPAEEPRERRRARRDEPKEPARRRGGAVVGMGDHVPAFMLREVNVSRIVKNSSLDDERETRNEAA